MPTVRSTRVKRTLIAAGAAAMVAAFAYALAPRAVPIDTAVIEKGTLKVTVDEEGRTRIREVYSVSAPASGRIRRSTLKPGDPVQKGRTVLAVVEPAVPPFLDLRSRRELEATIAAAEAAVALAEAELEQARGEFGFAEADLERARSLAQRDVLSGRNLQRAELDVRTRRAAVARAIAARDLKRQELESLKARRTGPEDIILSGDGGTCCIPMLAPADGRVLRVLKESEQVVLQGTPIIEIGDPGDLEVVVELLSADAVRVVPDAPAVVDAWGGPSLPARVTRIEPAGFKKVSALGIEEQRVVVVLSLGGPPDQRQRLGHDFHVFARIEVASLADVVQVPLGALFRTGNDWTAYVVAGGRAALRRIEIDARNPRAAAVRSGLKSGEVVILHPSDRVGEGVRVATRSR